jgi:hypothetical protein
VKPTVLLVTTFQWFPTARLAMALAKAGFVVKAVCPSRHPMFKTSAVSERFAYRGLAPLSSIAEAITAGKPDLIIPGDDLATQHLHRLYERESRKSGAASSICALIEKSLGPASSFPVAYSRPAFMNVAQQESIRIPDTVLIENVEQLRASFDRLGFPLVLKADGTSGGEGVRIARNASEAESAFRHLQAPPLLARALKRTLLDQDASLLLPSLVREKYIISAQKFVPGTEANTTVASWKGSVLAALHFEVVNKKSAAGHSTVVRLIENAEMMAAAERIARRLNLTGVYGFDFMLESATGHAYLIEINPRSTQVGHLALGTGRDIPAALYAAATGQTPQATEPVTSNSIIALFPQEWIRDADSPYLQSAYHDVPWEEAEFLRACVEARKKQQKWKAKDADLRNLSVVEIPRGTP